jgi:hypothetical protein
MILYTIAIHIYIVILSGVDTIFFWGWGVFKSQFIIFLVYLNKRSYVIIYHLNCYYYYVPYLMKIILLHNF